MSRPHRDHHGAREIRFTAFACNTAHRGSHREAGCRSFEYRGDPTTEGACSCAAANAGHMLASPGGSVCAHAVQELVQVESLAQMGVQLLLFTLGLEFSLAKLRVVRNVALLGAPQLLGSRVCRSDMADAYTPPLCCCGP